jgi:pyruvate/2-oxoglutarate dehydrogenase complex dihydrolipoamide dehydrogenase (E3) component
VIEAKTIVINTGSKAFVPPIPGVDSKRVYTSENLL